MNEKEFALHAALEEDHWWFRARRKILLQVFTNLIARNSSIVEIGCGTGGNLRALRYDYAVLGVDTNSHAVSYAREKGSTEVLEGDYRILLENEWKNIDAVLLADVLEHLDDDYAHLKYIAERLPPRALIVITVPAHQWLWSRHDEALAHCRRYSAQMIKMLCSSVQGYTQVMFTPFNMLLLPMIVFIRLFIRWLRTSSKDSDLHQHNGLVNAILYRFFSWEAGWIAKGHVLPFGTSYLVVLKKHNVN